MLVAQNSLGPVCPVPLTVRGNGVGRPKLDIQVVTDARTLRSRPRAFWEGLLAQLSTDNAPEAGHYVEKASAYLFHPSRAQ